MNNRIDPEGWSTKVTPLGNGKWGARVFYKGVVFSQDNSGESRTEAGFNLKHLLRWVNKTGCDSSMADKSRDRFFLGKKKP
jgi:hypothetical protein